MENAVTVYVKFDSLHIGVDIVHFQGINTRSYKCNINIADIENKETLDKITTMAQINSIKNIHTIAMGILELAGINFKQ